ncbi:DNA adenine methylase [Halococcus sp. IIIV-5B]|uniref:DNA adenine methylase n=1 Tax=Halococcus sp. IIIV-5B TaxID=2321230 RepID=UPI000E7635F0|nr:DNA adenine methylase [Halococcus sp. IIIV-5B]RJT04897.1 DNA adenine methylase [Halococcus sp. IIIV-5B]
MARPILKWAGGKRQLLDAIYDRFPRSYDRYHEPFLGGGALFFDLTPEGGTVNDTNPRLVNFYRQVRDSPDGLVARLESFDDPEADPVPDEPFADTDRKGKPIENYYYQKRAQFNCRPAGEAFDPLEEAALLCYLNRTGYNGLYRENRSGRFNVPIGRYANPDWVRREAIHAASRVLADTEVRNEDFEYVLDAAEPGDLVYFDPPYEPMSPTASFTDYSASGFGQDGQDRLLDTAAALDDAGVDVILSNSGVLAERYEQRGFDVALVGATRAINSDPDNRDEVDELVATNVPPGKRAER